MNIRIVSNEYIFIIRNDRETGNICWSNESGIRRWIDGFPTTGLSNFFLSHFCTQTISLALPLSIPPFLDLPFIFISRSFKNSYRDSNKNKQDGFGTFGPLFYQGVKSHGSFNDGERTLTKLDLQLNLYLRLAPRATSFRFFSFFRFYCAPTRTGAYNDLFFSFVITTLPSFVSCSDRSLPVVTASQAISRRKENRG